MVHLRSQGYGLWSRCGERQLWLWPDAGQQAADNPLLLGESFLLFLQLGLEGLELGPFRKGEEALRSKRSYVDSPVGGDGQEEYRGSAECLAPVCPAATALYSEAFSRRVRVWAGVAAQVRGNQLGGVEVVGSACFLGGSDSDEGRSPQANRVTHFRNQL